MTTEIEIPEEHLARFEFWIKGIETLWADKGYEIFIAPLFIEVFVGEETVGIWYRDKGFGLRGFIHE